MKNIKKTIVNFTPHDIHLHLDFGIRTIPANGEVARVKQAVAVVGNCVGVPICKPTFGEVEGLPPEMNSILIIVSAIVKNALPNRIDLVSPGELVRDNDGRIIGCKSLFA